MENQEFIKGKIINYNQEKGFGFIATATKGNVFFHKTKLEQGFEPQVQQAVLVQVKTSDKKAGAFDAVFVKMDTTPIVIAKEEKPLIEESPFFEGTVKFYDSEKGFGIAITKEKGDVFFHSSTLEKGFIPTEDDYVLLQVQPSKRYVGKFDATFVKENIILPMAMIFIDNSSKRKEIFEKLNERERIELLRICQEKANEWQLCDIWLDEFPISFTFEMIVSSFVSSNYSYKKIFSKLDAQKRSELLKVCEGKQIEWKLFDIWMLGFDVPKPSLNFVAKVFNQDCISIWPSNIYEGQRKEILNKFNQIENKKF